MKIYFIRHAETPGNLERRYIGRTDEPLSAEGERHAALDYGLPKTDRVYISPLKRARRTAEIMFPGAVLIPKDGLRETDFGDFEGKNAAELENDRDFIAWVDGFCESPPPNGESLNEFRDRTCKAFFEILQAEQDEKTVAVVAHGGTIMAVLSRFGEPPRRYFDWRMPNCGGYVIEYSGERLNIISEIRCQKDF